MKKAVSLCLAVLILLGTAGAELLTGLVVILPADELTLASFGSPEALELRFTGIRTALPAAAGSGQSPSAEKPRLGVTILTIPADEAHSLPQGASVSQVADGSYAERLGLQIGDIITDINGTVMTTSTEVAAFIDTWDGVQPLCVTVYRAAGMREAILGITDDAIDLSGVSSAGEYLALSLPEVTEPVDGMAELTFSFRITNYDLFDHFLPDEVSAALVYDSAYTYDAVCAFEKEKLGVLYETAGTFVFTVPGAVAADDAGRLVMTVNVGGYATPIYVDQSKEAAALGFEAAPSDVKAGLAVTRISQRLTGVWQDRGEEGITCLVIGLELFNNTAETVSLGEALRGKLTYRGRFVYQAEVCAEQPDIAPLETRTAYVVFRLPAIVAADPDAGASVLEVWVDGQLQDIAFELPQGGPRAYRKFSSPMTWSQAEAACEAAGGHLITVSSEEENDVISALAAGTTNFWLGGYRENDVWQWVTGETFDYTNFASDNDRRSGRYLFTYTGKAWSTTFNGRNSYICEWDNEADCPYPDYLTVQSGASCTPGPFRYADLRSDTGFQCALADAAMMDQDAEGAADLVLRLDVINRSAETSALTDAVKATLGFRGRYSFEPDITLSRDTLEPLATATVTLTFHLPPVVARGGDDDVTLSVTLLGEPAELPFVISQARPAD